jgi:tetratricopeptide (TPR) repeat protein
MPETEIHRRLHRILIRERDEATGQRAVERGWLTAAQLEEAQNEPGPVEKVLIGRGWLTQAQWDGLLSEQRSTDSGHRYASGVPDEVLAAAEDPSKRLSEYVLVSRLGQGGAAEIWKAWDLDLSRWVAVKRPHPTGGGSLERFKREALAAARLSHPNIVPIYRVSEEGGRPWIIMQLIEGKTLADSNLPLAQALRAIREAALAIDHAHQHGVVHRDLKPENIMLDRSGRVWVLDFGLAHLAEASRSLTATGAVLGTPAFMSPEQARGNAEGCSRLSDVYSLGATLYETITHRLPFDGRSMAEVVRQVAESEPVRPRRIDPKIPRDVETIILKSMEKEPRRRYASSAEFAEDLLRFLDGRPIRAHPPGAVHRAVKHLRRRPLVSVLAAGILLCVGTTGGVLIPGWAEENRLRILEEKAAAEERAKAMGARARTLQAIRVIAENTKEAVLETRRRGESVAAVRRALGKVLKFAYEEAAALAPELAEPHYLLGRVERAQMREEIAEKLQELALSKDPEFAPARYELIILLSRKYAKMVETLRLGLEPGGPAPTAEQIEAGHPQVARLRLRIERECENLRRNPAGLEGASLDCALGVAAAKLGRIGEARGALARAVERDPTLEEAFETLAELSTDPAEKRRWFTEGLKHDAGYLGHWIGRGRVGLVRGGDEDLGPAESDLMRAVGLDEECSEGWALAGVAAARRGFLRHRGEREAALSMLSSGLERLDRALSLDPGDFMGLSWRGLAREWVAKLKRDPSFHAKAEEDYTRAIELHPGLARVRAARARVRILRAGAAVHPAPIYRSAEEDLANVLTQDAENAGALALRGKLRIEMYIDRLADRDVAESGETDLRRSLRIEPSQFEPWYFLGRFYGKLAYEKNRAGERCVGELEEALRCYTRSIELNGCEAASYLNRGISRNNYWSVTGDVSELRRGIEDMTGAIGLNGDLVEAWVHRGNFGCQLARYHAAAGRANEEADAYRAARADYERAIEIRPAVASQVVESLRVARVRGGF